MDFYRFFVPAVGEGVLELPEDQAHHAVHVLRLASGARVVVFDGKGAWAEGVLRAGKRGAQVEVAGAVRQDPPAALRLTLATAVPKADRAEWLVEQASQLGVAAVQWLETDRGVVRPKESGGKMDKHRRLALESAKQCGRTHLMEVLAMRPLAEVLAAASAAGDTVLWLEPRAGVRVRAVGIPPRGGVTALIGPEGGWSEREMKILEGHAGIVRVKLTATILRIETACAAVAAAVLAG